MSVFFEIEAVGLHPNNITFNMLRDLAVIIVELEEAWEIADMWPPRNISYDKYTVYTMMKAVETLARRETWPVLPISWDKFVEGLIRRSYIAVSEHRRTKNFIKHLTTY